MSKRGGEAGSEPRPALPGTPFPVSCAESRLYPAGSVLEPSPPPWSDRQPARVAGSSRAPRGLAAEARCRMDGARVDADTAARGSLCTARRTAGAEQVALVPVPTSTGLAAHGVGCAEVGGASRAGTQPLCGQQQRSPPPGGQRPALAGAVPQPGARAGGRRSDSGTLSRDAGTSRALARTTPLP